MILWAVMSCPMLSDILHFSIVLYFSHHLFTISFKVMKPGLMFLDGKCCWRLLDFFQSFLCAVPALLRSSNFLWYIFPSIRSSFIFHIWVIDCCDCNIVFHASLAGTCLVETFSFFSRQASFTLFRISSWHLLKSHWVIYLELRRLLSFCVRHSPNHCCLWNLYLC